MKTKNITNKTNKSNNKNLTPLATLHNIVEEITKDNITFSNNPNDFTRRRKLPADVLINTILNMQGGPLNSVLFDAFKDVDKRMTASAFVQARGKLMDDTFQRILYKFNRTLDNPKTLVTPRNPKGYRVFAIDGTDFTTNYNPESEYVMPNGDNKPFCQIHANIMYDIMNRHFADCILQPRLTANEREAALQMMQNVHTGTTNIVIMDRGYTGSNMIEHCNRMPGIRYVIRDKAGKGTFPEISKLPDKELDVDIEFTVCTNFQAAKQNNYKYIHARKKDSGKELSEKTVYQHWDFESPCPVKFRVVKFRINDDDSGHDAWEVLVTNLDRFEFPIKEMKKLYHMRWDIETSFRNLKYSIGAIQYHSKKDAFIKQEIFAHLIMHNLVARTINKVEINSEGKKYEYRIDFKTACHVLRFYYRQSNFSEAIYFEMKKYICPVREGRSDPRKVKPKSAVWFVYRVA